MSNTPPTKSAKDELCSRDWVSDYQESHEDVDPISVFGAHTPIAASSAGTDDLMELDVNATSVPPNPKTDWTDEYYRILLGHTSRGGTDHGNEQSLPTHVMANKPLPPIFRPHGSPNISVPQVNTKETWFAQEADNGNERLDDAKTDIARTRTMSVDFSTFLTPSMDAAMSSFHRSEKSILLTSDDVVASIVSSTASGIGTSLAGQYPPDNSIADRSSGSKPTETEEENLRTMTPMYATSVASSLLASRGDQNEGESKPPADLEQRQPKKRKKLRRNREPDVKHFVKPLDRDVLLGRGGRSNHHPGNVAYRNQVGKLREWYRSSDKNLKTDLSQLLVDWVIDEQQGRFLKHDATTDQWYLITNIMARRKASQALREHMTQEERDAKKGSSK